MKAKKGITLVEVLIVMAILIILATAMIGGIDPIGLVNKARDAQRKKDIGRIKIAFEEYYNDKGCYPSLEMVTQMSTSTNCGSRIFSPWLTTWPCDPKRLPYTIVTGYHDVNNDCPKWYKIMASLENKSDKEVTTIVNISNLITDKLDLNYGVSSGNISLDEDTAGNDPYCLGLGNCYYYPEANNCNKTNGCSGSNCYLGECSNRCKVNCCGSQCE